MAQADKDFLTRLADRGEQVVGRITDLPGAKTIMETTTSLTKRLDDMQRRLRSLDPLEKRVTVLERRLDKLEGKGTSAKRSATKRTTSARATTAKAAPKKATRKSTTTRRPPSSSS